MCVFRKGRRQIRPSGDGDFSALGGRSCARRQPRELDICAAPLPSRHVVVFDWQRCTTVAAANGDKPGLAIRPCVVLDPADMVGGTYLVSVPALLCTTRKLGAQRNWWAHQVGRTGEKARAIRHRLGSSSLRVGIDLTSNG